MDKYHLTWEELYSICEKLEKHIKAEIDKVNGKEKFEYKLFSNTKNGLMLCIVFSKISHSFFTWDVELSAEKADAIIDDFENDEKYDIPNFYIFNKNFKNVVFPWESSVV